MLLRSRGKSSRKSDGLCSNSWETRPLRADRESGTRDFHRRAHSPSSGFPKSLHGARSTAGSDIGSPAQHHARRKPERSTGSGAGLPAQTDFLLPVCGVEAQNASAFRSASVAQSGSGPSARAQKHLIASVRLRTFPSPCQAPAPHGKTPPIQRTCDCSTRNRRVDQVAPARDSGRLADHRHS